MNLINGRLMSDKESEAQLSHIQETILPVLLAGPISREKVVQACDTLCRSLDEKEYLPLLLNLGMTREQSLERLGMARLLLSKEYLMSRLERELGPWATDSFLPYGSDCAVRQEIMPLGVLLHIAAGNVDALPAFSVIEGLLTGNVNILKLPGKDDGLSIPLLQRLIQLEPGIAGQIYVFNTASEDIPAMKKLADAADGIVVWGGDEAILSVRKLAGPETRLIEWGHKISFAYVSGQAADTALEELARHICETNQLLCNSCQGIYLDTEDYQQAIAFAHRFSLILERIASASACPADPYLVAQKRLEIYTEQLEAITGGKQVFHMDHCSVIAYADAALIPSYQFRNCWVKPLPRENLLARLRPYKNHLQTVALICREDEKSHLQALLSKTGAVRITSPGHMSAGYCGQPHDGEFSLRRYTKIMSFEA